MRHLLKWPLMAVLALAPATAMAWAGDGAINPIDTVWVMLCAALVLLMTPALAVFYGGMVRSKNVLSTLMHSFFAISLVTVQWVVIGYSLAFGRGNTFIGGLEHVMLADVGAGVGPYSGTIPSSAFMIYQLMFAIITPALISGAFAERMKFRAYVVFTLVWVTLVYDPVCHWVWSKGGWLGDLGALDFAGGTVVHINSAAAALVVVLVLGRRIDHHAARPHNLGLTVLGTGLLWFGWFGFNAGSALAMNAQAVNAFVVTHIAAATSAVAWAAFERMRMGRASSLGFTSGAIAGLVAITPACGFVGITGALAIGVGAGVLCNLGVLLRERLGYDDSLDVVGIHGVGGMWGALAAAIFAEVAIGGKVGLVESLLNPGLEGDAARVGIQALTIVATIAYSMIATYIIIRIIDKTIGCRVTKAEEEQGLDAAAHGEQGYTL